MRRNAELDDWSRSCLRKLSTTFSTGLWNFPKTQCTDVDKSVDNLGKQLNPLENFAQLV